MYWWWTGWSFNFGEYALMIVIPYMSFQEERYSAMQVIPDLIRNPVIYDGDPDFRQDDFCLRHPRNKRHPREGGDPERIGKIW